MLLVLLALLPIHPARAQQPDTAALYALGRTAEAEYERALRRLAPLAAGPRAASGCDEVVGRFCLHYDSGREPPPSEPQAVEPYRGRAIAAWTAAFEADPAHQASVFALVRLLLEAKRPADAHAVVERYRQLSGDVATGSMLAGLTRHASADIAGAEEEFARWLELLDERTRAAVLELEPLLARAEWKRVSRLAAPARRDYEARFWRFADALYLTPGNEIFTDHLSRHAENRLMRRVPVVAGSIGWGKDQAELTVRFGSPKARTRSWPTGMGTGELQIVEHYDPEQLTYMTPVLAEAVSIRPRPAVGWPLDTVRSITGHAPPTVRRMMALEHQANIFSRVTGAILAADAVLILDSIARGRTVVRSSLFVLDSAFNKVGTAPAAVRVAGDSVVISAEMELPREAFFYSLEVLEPATRLAARARFPLDRPAAGPLRLSDIRIADHDLILPPGMPIGIYAEVRTAATLPRQVLVELELTASDGTPVLVRAARWLGARLGLGGGSSSTRLGWTAELLEDPARLEVKLEPGRLRPGRYRLRMGVVDEAAGARAVSEREIVISEQ